jgi:hypothetical protein
VPRLSLQEQHELASRIPAPAELNPKVRTAYQLMWYFARDGRRDVLMPEIAKTAWSRCFGEHHEGEQDRWYRPYEVGVFHLERGQFYCSVRCAGEAG